MNEGHSRVNYNFNTEIKLEDDSPVFCQPRFNFRYKLLWLVLWPVYIFSWLVFLGNEELQEKTWDSNFWFYRVTNWHDKFFEWK